MDRMKRKAFSILYLPCLLNLDNPVNPVYFLSILLVTLSCFSVLRAQIAIMNVLTLTRDTGRLLD